MLKTWREGKSMKDSVEILNEKRRTKDAEIRNYVEMFLDSSLSTALDQCFFDAAKCSYNQETLKNFRRYIEELDEKGILSLKDKVNFYRQRESVVVFTLLHHSGWNATQKKLRMHALMFFFKHLSKESNGCIKTIAMPPELASIRPSSDKKRKAATFEEVQEILHLADKVSPRDGLVLEMIYQTERPLQDILRLKCEDINFEDKTIAGGSNIIDTIPMRRLKEYIESTKQIRKASSYVFISNQGKPLYRTQIQKVLEKTNIEAQLPNAITTKMIQRSKQSEKLNQEA
jgi:site-specific recombinase XerC